MTMKDVKLPPGWNESRIRRVLDFYEAQSDAEAAAQIEAASQAPAYTTMEVPTAFVPIVRTIIAERQAGNRPKIAKGKIR
jgi:hypothetical protein